MKAFFTRKEGSVEQKRWTVLTKTSIDFYAKSTDKIVLDSTDLKMIAKVRTKAGILELLLKDGKKRKLKAGNPSICTKWKNQLRVVCAALANPGAKGDGKVKQFISKAEMDKEIKQSKLQQDKVEKDLYFDLASRGSVEEMKKLNKIDPNKIKDSAQNNPLHIACRGGNMEAVKYLVMAKKMNVNEPNQNKDTPMHIASWKGHYPVCQFLMLQNPNHEALNKEGKRPVDVATKLKVKALLESVFANDDEFDDSQDVDEDAD